MDFNTSPFLAFHDQEFPSYDPNQNEYAFQALLGLPPVDQTEGFFYLDHPHPSLNLHDFLDQYHVPADPPASPETVSSLSLPSTPLSLTDDPSELGVVDAPAPYDPSFSPSGLSITSTLCSSDANEVKSTKTDLDGFEYNPFTRKWVCPKCKDDFVSTHEARRHVKTAAKCTGRKVECLRCGDRIHASHWSRKRHFTSKKCQKGGRKRGTPTYTVNNAYVEVKVEL